MTALIAQFKPVVDNEKPVFPKRTVFNRDRRRKQLLIQLGGAPEKEYESHNRSVRPTRGTVDPVLWLRKQYTNEVDQMICQICKEEMPFRKRDGKYYFEAVEAPHFPKEHEAQYLALCPLCAAMYKEFVKHDEDAMETLKSTMMNSDEPEIPLRLGKLNTSVRFVESHYHDIKITIEKTIIEAQV